MGFIQDKTAELNAEITAEQAQLAILASLPEDTYPLGTVAIFAWNSGRKHFLKEAEEAWRSMSSGSTVQKELAYWIFLERELNPELYFEVYIMTAAALPIYASA
jgi:hypothetical protein